MGRHGRGDVYVNNSYYIVVVLLLSHLELISMIEWLRSSVREYNIRARTTKSSLHVYIRGVQSAQISGDYESDSVPILVS